MSGRNPLRNLPLPPGQIIGMALLVVIERLRGVRRLPGPRATHTTAGSVLMMAGCALTGWALSERRRHATDGFDLERPQALVTSGPYRLSRHPMYVGWWLIHFGFGVLRGSGWVFLTVPAAVLAEHDGVIAEEKMLAEAFGPRYLDYTKQVPRYVSPATIRAIQRLTARSA